MNSEPGTANERTVRSLLDSRDVALLTKQYKLSCPEEVPGVSVAKAFASLSCSRHQNLPVLKEKRRKFTRCALVRDLARAQVTEPQNSYLPPIKQAWSKAKQCDDLVQKSRDQDGKKTREIMKRFADNTVAAGREAYVNITYPLPSSWIR